MYDSIYHALAIVEDGVFVTADNRHFEKVKNFGHIALLKDWETIFAE
jgi:predicted nucleic acid-binding protein